MPSKDRSTGLISEDRLRLIPVKHRVEHEYCFLLHDYMANLLVETERVGANVVQIQFESEADRLQFESLANIDVVDALNAYGSNPSAKLALAVPIIMALYSDMLHFIYEGMTALEKRKFTVGLSLLRKPLKENLFLAAWLLGDEEDFFRAFSKDPSKYMDSQSLQKAKRIDVFRKCLGKISHSNMFDGDLLYSILYDKKLQDGLSNLFDKATHLVTSNNMLIRTEKQNLNFIFKSPLDDDIYEFIYQRLSYLVIFLLLVQHKLFDKMQSVAETYISYSELIALGGYNLLFDDGRFVTKDIYDELKPVISCPHCKGTSKIKKFDGPKLLFTENMICNLCGNAYHFPLFWLLSKMNFTFNENKPG